MPLKIEATEGVIVTDANDEDPLPDTLAAEPDTEPEAALLLTALDGKLIIALLEPDTLPDAAEPVIEAAEPEIEPEPWEAETEAELPDITAEPETL